MLKKAALRIGPREVLYENKYHRLYRVEAVFDHGTKEYYVTDWGQRVGLLVLKGDAVLLVRQYRLLINGLSWEIPGGKADEGETPEMAAVRECLEETGLHCRELKPLLSFHPGLDTFHNPTDLFYTDTFIETPQGASNSHEIDEDVWVPLDECIEMVSTQRIVDSLSIVALLAYQALIRKR